MSLILAIFFIIIFLLILITDLFNTFNSYFVRKKQNELLEEIECHLYHIFKYMYEDHNEEE